MGLLPDGAVTEYRDGRELQTEGSARSAPLAELLRRFARPGAAG